MIGVVGPLVDEVLGSPEGGGGTPSTGSVYAGPEYDISIGGLGFNLWPDTERPYERATAKFRKDQFDVGQSAGDQSLTGYWTRGQAGFHGGAGIKYYDVTVDEETTTRFRESWGVDPFASLGEVVLDRRFEAVEPYFLPYCVVPMPKVANSVAAINGVGPARRISRNGTSATISTATAGVHQDLAASSENLFIAVGTSVEKVTGTTGVVHVTNGDSQNWAGIWVVKSRLLMVDEAGVWFTAPLTGSPVTVTANANAIWKSPHSGVAIEAGVVRWWVAETPSMVLIGRDENLYALSVEDDGTIIAMEAPRVVAQLPPGEVVRGLGCYQGLVVIATSAGIRVAEMAPSQVTYGPLLVREECQTYGLGYRDGKVWVATVTRTGTGVAEGKIYMVSLEGPLTSRVWPYAAHSTAGRSSFTTDSSGGFVHFGWVGLEWLSDELIPEGWLTTGLHRFGTMELKKFQSVTVRAGGEGGRLQVTRVYVDGSEAPLHEFNLADSSSVTIDLREDSPLEMLGLKFTLFRDENDPTKGPVFQGYQLRALPAPKRQRMVRLPLMLFDTERNGTTGRPTGNEGSAWRRLAELESMESSGGTFMYMDRRTNEIAEVFIESVEHVGVTSPKARTSGFGGMVFVTLRLLN